MKYGKKFMFMLMIKNNKFLRKFIVMKCYFGLILWFLWKTVFPTVLHVKILYSYLTGKGITTEECCLAIGKRSWGGRVVQKRERSGRAV